MKLLDLKTGREVSVPKLSSYMINWHGKGKSKFQDSVKAFLYNYWRNDFVFEEFPVPRTRLSLDFFNRTKMIAVEVQGAQHTKYIPHFHGQHNYKFLTQLKRDEEKQRFCERFGVRLVEIYPSDIVDEDLFRRFDVEL